MTRREYLSRLRAKAGESRSENAHADPRAPILPVDSPATRDALARIMAQTGFSAEQIAGRFPEAGGDAPEEPRGRIARG
ncbi:hypothetical protein FF100_26875 [Methylobacterium terricola]|uniref:Uncharacterized protein n=1 Tax=Methylobacterium terricola TaxID=2583531 RepID=A0A5C4LBW4_9HYPH|nr:hypothetical protein [Methylobacterium terricola]TNC09194.1 hypothetical protein FF100_26875 [Methylobacterium terricola]